MITLDAWINTFVSMHKARLAEDAINAAQERIFEEFRHHSTSDAIEGQCKRVDDPVMICSTVNDPSSFDPS